MMDNQTYIQITNVTIDPNNSESTIILSSWSNAKDDKGFYFTNTQLDISLILGMQLIEHVGKIFSLKEFAKKFKKLDKQ